MAFVLPIRHDKAERAHRIHAEFCPVAWSLQGSIAITTSLQMEEL